MAERPPAYPEEISYNHFAEQIDPETGIRVGLVPLLEVFKTDREYIKRWGRYHDIGGGTGASFEFFIDHAYSATVRTVDGVISDPSNVVSDERKLRLLKKLNSITFLNVEAQNAVRIEHGCDLETAINMWHLIPQNERGQVIQDLIDALNPGGYFILSTTFLPANEWVPDRNVQVERFRNGLGFDVMRCAKKMLCDKEFSKLRKDIKENKLEHESYKVYEQELREAGFEVVMSDLVEMPCNIESYDLISMDNEWLKHVVPGVQLEEAAEISRAAVAKVKKDKEIVADTPLPRNTWVGVFRKPIRTVEVDDRSVLVDHERLASV